MNQVMYSAITWIDFNFQISRLFFLKIYKEIHQYNVEGES